MTILAFDKIHPGAFPKNVNPSTPPALVLGKPLAFPDIKQLDGKTFPAPDLPTDGMLTLTGGPGPLVIERFPVTLEEAAEWLAARRGANDQLSAPLPAMRFVHQLTISDRQNFFRRQEALDSKAQKKGITFYDYEEIHDRISSLHHFVSLSRDRSGHYSAVHYTCWEKSDGERIWTNDPPPCGRPLYHRSWLSSKKEMPLLFLANEKLCEGVGRCFDGVFRASLTTSGGWRDADKTDYSPVAGRDVYIWSERSLKGDYYAATLGNQLLDSGCTVTIVDHLALFRAFATPAGKTRRNASPVNWGPLEFHAEGHRLYLSNFSQFQSCSRTFCRKTDQEIAELLKLALSGEDDRYSPDACLQASSDTPLDDGAHITSYSASGAAAMFADATTFTSNTYGTEGVLTVPNDRDDGRKILEIHILPPPTNNKEKEFYSRLNGFRTHCYSHDPTWDHPDDRAFVVETLGLGNNGVESTVSQEEVESRRAEAEAKRLQKTEDQKAIAEDFESCYIFSDTCRFDDDPKKNPATAYLRDTRHVVINPESGAKLTYSEPRWKKVDGESVFDGFVQKLEPKLVVPRHDFITGERIGYELERLNLTHVDGGVRVTKGAFFRDVARLPVGCARSYMLARSGVVGTPTLAVGEGFITTVSGSMLPIPAISVAAVWALGGKSNFRHLDPSLPFDNLFIFVDSDLSEGGEKSALNLADRWRKAGKAVTLVRFPVPADHQDSGSGAIKWDANDLIRHCAEKGREPVQGEDFTLEVLSPVVVGPTAEEAIRQTALAPPATYPPAVALSKDQTDEDDADEEVDDDPPEVVVTLSGDNSGERAADLGNARRFVRFCDDNVRYVHAWKTWVIWNGEYWERDDSGQINRLAYACVDQMYRDAVSIMDQVQRDAQLKHAMKSHGKTPIDNMVGLARDMVPLSANALDSDPFLLGVQNGVVNLKTGKLRQSRKSDYITKRANVAFDANATCPNWDEFQEKISGGNNELVAFKQEMYGLGLSGKILELLFILFGDGSNGKSTEVTTLQEICGDYAGVSDQYLIMERSSKDRGATPEVVALKGKRWVVINETSEGDVLDDRAVKRCTSNEPITGRGLYEGLTTFMPTHTTFLLTNHKPRIRGTDYGIWRRLAYVPYPVTISASQKIEHYRERFLVPEASGILNWMLAGWMRLYKNGMKLEFPKVVTDAALEYKTEQNTIRQFVEVCCVVSHPQQSTLLSTLHEAYQQWMSQEYGYRGRGRKQMSAELEEMGRTQNFQKIKDGSGYTAFRGLGLKTQH